jgi:hypothetical protein
MKKILFAAGSVLLCGAMALAQDATTTQSGNGNVTGQPTGTATTETKKDTVVMPKKKVVHSKKNTMKGGGQKMAAAPADLGRGGKAIGHDVKGGHPVAAAKAGGKGAGDFGTTVGSGTKDAAIGAKDKTGKGLSAVGNKLEGKKKTQSDTSTTTSTENPK